MRHHTLPPLHSLIAFEAVVRRGSFTRAAAELNLSQSAISRQIMTLEAFLGRKLFVREHRKLQLTQAGQRYAAQVRDILDACSRATGEVMKHGGRNDLTLACSSGIAQFWLTPRLKRFHALHPDIQLRIIVRDAVASLSSFEFDAGIYYLRKGPPFGFQSTPLLDEEVFPVCAPGYLAAGRRLSPAALRRETLLVLDDAQSQWMSWHDWFGYQRVHDALQAQTVTVNLYPPLVEMAINGQGVVLGWRHIIDSQLERGALVRASDASASHGGGFHLITPLDRRENHAMQRFRAWLMTQLPPAD